MPPGINKIWIWYIECPSLITAWTSGETIYFNDCFLTERVRLISLDHNNVQTLCYLYVRVYISAWLAHLRFSFVQILFKLRSNLTLVTPSELVISWRDVTESVLVLGLIKPCQKHFLNNLSTNPVPGCIEILKLRPGFELQKNGNLKGMRQLYWSLRL